MDTNYASNSNKFREKSSENTTEREPVQKVISGEIIERKRSVIEEVASSFFQRDMRDIKKSLVEEVLLPNIMDGLYDLFQNSLAVVFNKAPTARKSSGQKISYGNYYNSNRSSDPVKQDKTGIDRYDFSTIVFQTWQDADDVLSAMVDYIETYESITVSTFLDMVGKRRNTYHTDEKYGWTSLGASRIKRVRDGYILELPRVTVLS